MTKSSVQTPLLDEAQEIVAARAPQPLTAVRDYPVVRSNASPAPMALDEKRLAPSLASPWLSDLLQGDAPASRTLVDIFMSSVVRWPRQVALQDRVRSLSYEQLAKESQRLADRLAAHGVGRGDRVGVRVPSGTADLYIAVLGTLLAGATYVPVDFADPQQRAELIWSEVDACAVISAELEITERHRGTGQNGPVRPDDDCWVIFTSGSTGAPKGVVVGHRAAAAFVDAEAGLWRVQADDRVLAGLSVGFDASCEEMWLAWRNGAALVTCPRSIVQSGVDLGPWLVERGITVVSTVPTLAAMWDDEALAKVRLLILGGEACPNELGWRLAAGREVWNTYGPTEATVVSTAARVWPGQQVTIGHPLRGWKVAVVDPFGDPVPLGATGELVIAGVGLGRYLDADLDQRRFAGLPALGFRRAYHTGDMAREGAGGIEFLGRRDDQVKIGGRRIELAEIDAQLCGVPGVKAAATAVQKTSGGNTVLVGYFVGDLDPTAVRARVAEQLPEGIVPVVVRLDALPLKSSGKVDRKALPWPPPTDTQSKGGPASRSARWPGLTGTAAWLAERWADQLGPLPISRDSDFFELGGTSLAVAKLVSVLRERYPATAVADVYNYRGLDALAERLDHLAEAGPKTSIVPASSRRWGAVQLLGVFVIVALGSLQWLAGLLAYNQWFGIGPQIGWAGVIAAWLVFSSAPSRAAIVTITRRVLLGRLRPGRYPRQGWLSCRVWFVERLADAFHVDILAGTPWAARYASMNGARIGDGARLATLPSPTGLLSIGEGATLEAEVDAHGWWIEGRELVVGEIHIGAGARIGTRALLMPGADVGAGAEIEPGSVVNGTVPAGERWSGSPARRVGLAGETWPAPVPVETAPPRAAKTRFALGLVVLSLLPLAAAVPGFVVLNALGGFATAHSAALSMLIDAPLIAAMFLATYCLLVVVAVRSVSWLVRPGWHSDSGATAWALWFSGAVMAQASGILFPLYSSIYTRRWLALLGIKVGKRTEVSTAVGLNRLVSFADTSFAADDVVFAGTRARGGRIEITPIEVGSRTFLGNGAILRAGTKLGNDSLVGVLSSPPLASADGTSWLGLPALELPRVAERTDPSRTTTPPPRLIAGRAAMELVRILLPTTLSVALGALVFFLLESIGTMAGVFWLAVGAPFVLLAASLCAVGATVCAKWLLMGRYEPGEHPLWSFFVWRDELVNTLQEQLAGAWLLSHALGSPVVPAYLRVMGAKIGKNVWFETLAVTEFDLVSLGDGCAVNRGACIETHLFHDRLLRMGPARLGSDSTLGPNSAVLPDTILGDGCSVGGRSVVLRGERLPSHTRWHGAPVENL
jgi:non-ribosomal peptide synthetase-like protein